MQSQVKERRAEQLNICLIAPPFESGSEVPDRDAEQFLRVFEPLSKRLSFITGNYPESTALNPRIHLTNLVHNRKDGSLLARILDYVMIRLKITLHLAKVANGTDVFVFLGMSTLFLPIVVARLLGKTAVYISIGSIAETTAQIYKETLFGFAFAHFFAYAERMQYRFSKRVIVLYPQSCITDLAGYRNKISVASHHFLKFDRFAIQKNLKDRHDTIGYIGRLSEEKGIQNFIEAIPFVLQERKNATFLIGGDGQLQDRVKEFIVNEKLDNKVRLTGWIPHDQVPEYLNELKLLVLPSYTEGLPNIILEAMACGTPVLATRVGGVPGVIKDGITGFTMNDNSPETIARNVIKALDCSNLENVAQNAHFFVKREFTYEAAVERYRNALTTL